MITKDIKFEIAQIKFHYIYESEINISNRSSIHHFVTDNSDCDIINYIRVNSDLEKLNGIKDKPIFITPAWSMYKEFVLFHPKGEIIAKMRLLDGFNQVETSIIDLDFFQHPLPICITGLLLQKKLVETKSGFIMHGATINILGKAYIFTGNSGVGKSTLSRILKEEYPVEQISDDRFILRKVGDILYAFGNPFDCKIERNINKGIPVDTICFLHHASKNFCKLLNSKNAIKKLFTISLLPYWQNDALLWSVVYLHELAKNTPCYDLFFRPDSSAFEYLKRNILIKL